MLDLLRNTGYRHMDSHLSGHRNTWMNHNDNRWFELDYLIVKDTRDLVQKYAPSPSPSATTEAKRTK